MLPVDEARTSSYSEELFSRKRVKEGRGRSAHAALLNRQDGTRGRSSWTGSCSGHGCVRRPRGLRAPVVIAPQTGAPGTLHSELAIHRLAPLAAVWTQPSVVDRDIRQGFFTLAGAVASGQLLGYNLRHVQMLRACRRDA